MPIRPCGIMPIILAVLVLGACDQKPRPEAELPAAVTEGPDPAAPAPGTQAAEAIGADSASDAPMIPPEKKPH